MRGRRIAIKALSKSTIKRHNLAQRVRNEVSIHYQLQHPNVLELLHFFEDSEHVFLVMELAAGELYQRVTRQRLSEAEIRRVFAALVEGLSYLHSHGIIHRDLKLSNILLSDDMTPVCKQMACGPFTMGVAENCRLWLGSQGGRKSRMRTADPLRNSELSGAVGPCLFCLSNRH